MRAARFAHGSVLMLELDQAEEAGAEELAIVLHSPCMEHVCPFGQGADAVQAQIPGLP